MNIDVINKEIKSPALKEISTELHTVLKQVQAKNVTLKEGMVQIVNCKHMIQTIALDWSFNRKKLVKK